MALINQVIEGLSIFVKYNGQAQICAEHDVIYAGVDIEVSDEDACKLDELGWHYDKSVGSWGRFV